MERYDDSIYGGGNGEYNAWVQLSVDHPRVMSTMAAIGVLLVVIIIFIIVVHLVSQYFGWGKYGKCKTDSFVGSYMHWRPNVQDKSEINAIIDANAGNPPIPIPTGLYKSGNDTTYLESNIGSL